MKLTALSGGGGVVVVVGGAVGTAVIGSRQLQNVQ